MLRGRTEQGAKDDRYKSVYSQLDLKKIVLRERFERQM